MKTKESGKMLNLTELAMHYGLTPSSLDCKIAIKAALSEELFKRTFASEIELTNAHARHNVLLQHMAFVNNITEDEYMDATRIGIGAVELDRDILAKKQELAMIESNVAEMQAYVKDVRTNPMAHVGPEIEASLPVDFKNPAFLLALLVPTREQVHIKMKSGKFDMSDEATNWNLTHPPQSDQKPVYVISTDDGTFVAWDSGNHVDVLAVTDTFNLKAVEQTMEYLEGQKPKSMIPIHLGPKDDDQLLSEKIFGLWSVKKYGDQKAYTGQPRSEFIALTQKIANP